MVEHKVMKDEFDMSKLLKALQVVINEKIQKARTANIILTVRAFIIVILLYLATQDYR